jgi:[ribosomal protein S5]-alanine N-acetyltransferase
MVKMSSIFDIFPFIDLKQHILRRIDIENDYKDFYNYITHPLVTKYLSQDDVPTNVDSAKYELGYWDKMFDRKVSIYWAIALKADNRIIGTAGFNFWNQTQRRAELSYDLDPNFWNQGITTNAIEALSKFALEDMNVQRIQATVALDNYGSIRVLEKNGFKREGILDKYGYLNGEMVDFYMYSKTK